MYYGEHHEISSDQHSIVFFLSREYGIEHRFDSFCGKFCVKVFNQLHNLFFIVGVLWPLSFYCMILIENKNPSKILVVTI